MPTATNIYHCINSSPEYKTVRDYCTDYNSPAFKFAGKETQFLDVEDEYGIPNRSKLVLFYTDYEKNIYQSLSDADLPMRVGVKFAIPKDHVERNGLLTQGMQVVSNDDVAFKSAALAKLEADKGYVSITKPVQGKINSGITKEMVPEATVWIWCRSLNQVFDVTPFVSSVTTNMNRTNGGNWQITLPPLVAVFVNGAWGVKKDSLNFYTNPKNLSLAEQGYVAEASIYDENGKRNQFLFHSIIHTNDLVFIRFETLQLEKDKRFADIDKLYVDKSQIPGKIYDMIGLVDIDGSSINPTDNDASISISGRDLSKLLIEDGSYYYTFEQTQGGQVQGMGQVTSNNGLLERVFSEDALAIYALWYNQSIEHVFEFVLNQLSNIKIVPDDLFEAYDRFSSNKRNTKFTSGDAFKTKKSDVILQQYKSDAITNIRQLRLQNGLNNSDANKETTQLDNLFNDLRYFLSTLRRKEVRKVDGNNTSGWMAFSWESPTKLIETLSDNEFPTYFDGKLYKLDSLQSNGSLPFATIFANIFSNIDQYIDVSDSQGSYKEQFKEVLAAGIWQIIKLVVDKGVTNRRINDCSISTASGSIINFLNRMCQYPFVELILDTYHDNYVLVVRKPPTDQIGILSLIEGKVETEDGRVTNGTPVIVDVEDFDVLKEDLFFDDKDVYTWYHLRPEASYINADTYSYAYLPALYFPEYADIWGSRPMDLTHKYTPYVPLDPKSTNDLDINQKQAVHDLKFMIESNQANPFMRKGSLVLNGDRRIKVGNILRYKPTGEIFTIDSVQQNYRVGESAIDRTTTVYVSRGMVEQLIYGVPYLGSKNQEADHISYFNIINTKLSLNYIDTSETVERIVQDGYETVNATVLPPLSKNYPSDSVVKDGNKGLDLLNKYNADQKARFIQLINAINSSPGNYYVEVLSTVRPKQQKDIIYQAHGNATVINRKVTSSPIGHADGNSIDFNIIRKIGGNRTKSVVTFQKVTLEDNLSKWMATGVPQLAKSIGFLWGGDSFSGSYDPVHFQLIPEETRSKQIPKTKVVKEVVKKRHLDASAMFSNFKVNKHVLEFFLRGEQFDKKYNSETINRKIYRKEILSQLQ
jgi:hypothetical protein